MTAVRPFRFGVLGITRRDTMADWSAAARRVEALGYSTFHLTDHFDRSPVAPVPMLAALAMATSEVTLGTLVLDNDFRHPAVLAKELATLDLIAPGRFEIGLGAGWMHVDYTVSGIAFERAGVRIDKMAEALAILDDVLRGGPTTFTGAHYQVDGLLSCPPPSTRPRLRLLVGGGGPRVLSIAGRYADIVSLNWVNDAGRVGDASVRSGDIDRTTAKIEAVRTGAGDRFADIELHLVAYFAGVTDDPAGRAAELIAQRGLGLTPDELLASPHCLLGTVDQIVERLRDARDQFGISYVSFYDTVLEEMAPVVAALAGT